MDSASFAGTFAFLQFHEVLQVEKSLGAGGAMHQIIVSPMTFGCMN